jgi:hypothetical protein
MNPKYARVVLFDLLLHGNRSAGNWLFQHRRWLNPTNVNDCRLLSANYDDLRAAFPVFGSCLKDTFLSTVQNFASSWERTTANDDNELEAVQLQVNPGDFSLCIPIEPSSEEWYPLCDQEAEEEQLCHDSGSMEEEEVGPDSTGEDCGATFGALAALNSAHAEACCEGSPLLQFWSPATPPAVSRRHRALPIASGVHIARASPAARDPAAPPPPDSAGTGALGAGGGSDHGNVGGRAAGVPAAAASTGAAAGAAAYGDAEGYSEDLLGQLLRLEQ